MPQIEGMDVHVEVVDDRVEALTHGTYSLRAGLKLLDLAFDAAAREKLARILVDVRGVEGNPNVSDRYEIGTLVATRCAERHFEIRVAFVGSEPLIDPERFGELVARNRFARAKVFDEKDRALTWLSKASER